MEAAELDLHAIRSVAEHRLHGAGKQFADLYSRIDGATVTLTPEDQLLLATMPFNIQDVEDIVNERGPKTISGRPFWEVEPARMTMNMARTSVFPRPALGRDQDERAKTPPYLAGHSSAFSGGSGSGADQL